MANFLENYFTYTEGTETPELYDLWSALTTLSSIVSRRVWVSQGYYMVYANLYVVLVGAPGGRKTSAMNISKDMMRDIGNIPFASTAMTKEALCLYMSKECLKTFQIPGTTKIKEYTPITLCLTELSHFLGSGTSAHMIDFLTTIYDQEVYDAKTKNKGNDIIPGPYLTILACTTPSNITRYLKEDVISGGFSRRTLFAFELAEGEPIPFPEITPSAQAAWDACIEWGKKLQQVAGEFLWTPEAHSWYGDWYCSLFNENKNRHNLMTKGYFRSKHIQLLKVAMLFALSESLVLVLKKDHLLMGLEALEKLEVNMDKVFEGMGRNELNAVSAEILNILGMAGKPLSEKEVYSIMYKSADTREIASILHHLVSSEKVIAATMGSRRVLMLPEIAKRLNLLLPDQDQEPPAASSGPDAAPTENPAKLPDVGSPPSA